MDAATRLAESIIERFFFLASFPYVGRGGHEHFRRGVAQFAVANTDPANPFRKIAALL